MKSAVFYGKKDVRVMESPEPVIKKPDGVKIKIECCGICGSDLEEYYYGPVVVPTSVHPLTGREMPLILGHEFSGEVTEVGAGVTKVKVGDKVVCNPVVGCGECYWCKKGVPCLCESMCCTGLQSDGGFAEYIVMPENNCTVLPEGTAMDAITIVEPCATAIRNVRRGGVQVGDNVLVIGAGTVGLLTVQAARIAGAAHVIAIEPNEFRGKVALETGADAVFSPFEDGLKEKIKEATRGAGVNVVIECTGKESSPALALELIEKGGNIVLIGICPEPSPMLTRNIARNEINIFGIHGYTQDDVREASFFLQTGKIDVSKLITGHIALDDIIEKGFEQLGPNGGEHIKIIVDMKL